MKMNIIRLTESDLRRMVDEAVSGILSEYGRKSKKRDVKAGERAAEELFGNNSIDRYVKGASNPSKKSRDNFQKGFERRRKAGGN